MPFYSDELIEEVRSRSDIVDVVGQYVHLTKRGTTYFGLCPFHNEKTPSFSVAPNKQMYYCFGCGAGGNVFSFLMNYENWTFPEAMSALADRAGIELPKQEMTREQRMREDKRSRLLEINKEAAKYYYMMLRNDQGKQAMDYFKGRELTDETMQKFGLGYTGKYSNGLYQYLKGKGYQDQDLADSGLITIDERRGAHDKFWNRAMFPIMDANNKVIAFGGRVMGEGEPKYLNSPETMIFNKSRNLFGLFLARRTKRPQMILCEGYMDVISMHQAGFDNTVASLGTALTEGHAQLLKRYTREVYLSYDSDGAGVKAALRAIPILKAAGITCKIINMRPYKDPDEFMKALGPEEYQKRIDNAENSFMFQIRMLERDYDLKDPESNTEFFKEVAKKIGQFTEEIERSNYEQAVADHYQRSANSIHQLVVHMATQEGILGRNKNRRPRPVAQPQQEGANVPPASGGHDDFDMAAAYADAYDMEAAYGSDAYLGAPGGSPMADMPASDMPTNSGLGQQYRSTIRKRGNTREDGMKQSQRLLLTWMVEDPHLYGIVEPYISPDDFAPGIYRQVAEEVWQQLKDQKVNPALIVSHFSSESDEDQREVAKIFNTTVGEITNKSDREKALKETMVRIKKDSNDRIRHSTDSTSPDVLMKLITAKRQLQEMERMELHLS